jgi:type IV secretory pathway VirD2 relaxase
MVREHAQFDLTRYTALFMAQVERDLGRPLDWVAANHCDTEHPHTHIVLRGRDRAGKDLYMERDYFQYGLRARASQLLTWFFGPVRQQQAFLQSDRQVYDGVLRGLDDPDLRARSQTDILADARTRAAQQPSRLSGVGAFAGGEALGQYAAWLAAMHQALAAQQQHQAQQRGGWGYGQ